MRKTKEEVFLLHPLPQVSDEALKNKGGDFSASPETYVVRRVLCTVLVCSVSWDVHVPIIFEPPYVET